MSLSDLLKSNQYFPGKPTEELAYGYIRVSHERSAEKAISPETQRQQIEAYAQRQGYRIVAWYIEEGGASAFRESSKRPKFDRMIEDAKVDPQISIVLVAYYDRLSRELSAQARQDDLLRHGVRIESAAGGYYDPETESGVILSGVNWSLAHLFSLKIRNRVIPTMKTNFAERDPDSGWAWKNGEIPQFGYAAKRIYIGRNKESMQIHKLIWVLNEEEVAGKPIWQWARTMLLDWRLKERLGYDVIADRLTESSGKQLRRPDKRGERKYKRA